MHFYHIQRYPYNNTMLLKRFGSSSKTKLLPQVKQLPQGKQSLG